MKKMSDKRSGSREKLVLQRETMRRLDTAELRAAGAGWASETIHDPPSTPPTSVII